MRQQLRWKRSWTRESLIVARFIWRKHPLAAISAYVGIAAAARGADRRGARGRLAAARRRRTARRSSTWSASTRWRSRTASTTRCASGRYDALWIFGVAFCFFYLVFLLWQTYFAILTARTSSWGTRPATAGQAA